MTDEVDIRCALGAGALLVLTAVVLATGAVGTGGVALLLGATVLGAWVLDRRRALLLGLTGWALVTGFVVNTAGDLTATAPDVVRLAAFLLAATAAAERTARS